MRFSYLKQLFLLDDFCLLLGCLAGLFGKSLPFCRHNDEVPNPNKGKEQYDSNQKGNYDINCHE